MEHFDFFLEPPAKTTHLAIGAHPDDIAIMAFHGIEECIGNPTNRFTGVIVGDGSCSLRVGTYASNTPKQMADIRQNEQLKEAKLGNYSHLYLLNTQPKEMRFPHLGLYDHLYKILHDNQPETVYIHSPFCSHEHHLVAMYHSLAALRELPVKPSRVYGCEVTVGHAMLPDNMLTPLPVRDFTLARALISAHESQSGIRPYAEATIGRWISNSVTHSRLLKSDQYIKNPGVSLAVDLTSFVRNSTIPIEAVVEAILDEQNALISDRLKKVRDGKRLPPA